MEDIEIRLPSKPTAPLQTSLYLPPMPSSTLIVFLNGLILPRTAWSETIDHLLLSSDQQDPFPHAILTYDRFGQGTSPSDPANPPSTPYGHDALSIIADLHSLLTEVIHTRLSQSPSHLNLILVCSSIGCPLSRLFASAHHSEHEVVGYIFLDSMMANTDFVSLFPDPSSPDFDPSQLPEGITLSDIEHARSRFRDMFHPDVGNPEKFDRRRLREQLPFPDEPKLPTLAARNGEEDETEPRLIVVGHDPETFAEQCEKVNVRPLLS